MGLTYNVIDADGHVLEPFSSWKEYLEPAILDRILHRAHRIELKGPSLRRRLVAAESPAA